MLDFSRLVTLYYVGGICVGGIAISAIAGFSPTANLAMAQPVAVQQGNQIIFNGRTISAEWQGDRDDWLGVSDMVLLSQVGLQLLDTKTASQQPVDWFTPSAQPLILPTQLTATTRLLNIRQLARQFGWHVAIVGSRLQITTPSSRILGIRQSQQAWGDRLVLELDQPAPWQIDSLSQNIQLAIDAQIDSALQQKLNFTAGKFLSAVQVEPMANQTRLRINLTTGAARVWSLANPNRIVVDLRPDALVEQTILWTPDLRWQQKIVPVGNIAIPTTWLEVTLKQPGISLQPILPNPTSMTGIAPLSQTAQQNKVAAAINGGFFNRDRQLPLGAIRFQNRWLSGAILNRGAIAWDASGTVRFDRLSLQETVILPNGQRFSLTHLNSGYLQAGIARYTPDWGTYTPLSDGEIIVFVQNNQVIGQQAIAQAGTFPVQVPANGYILVMRSLRSAASAFTPGINLQLTTQTNPPDFLHYPYILGAGPLLIQNQQIVLDAKAESFSPAFANEAAPRSAIAQRADGTVLLVTAHTRLDGTSLTLLDMAQLLQQLGAIHALNLDGGSSTTLYLGGKILDRSPRSAARVHNGVGVFIIKP